MFACAEAAARCLKGAVATRAHLSCCRNASNDLWHFPRLPVPDTLRSAAQQRCLIRGDSTFCSNSTFNWKNAMFSKSVLVLASFVTFAGAVTSANAVTLAPTPVASSDVDQKATATDANVAYPGISKDQADEILHELKAIHALLERQQVPATVRPSPVGSEKVKLHLPENAPSIGRDDALVTLVEFGDFQCPFCKKFHTDTFPEIKRKLIDTGKLRYVVRDFPLDFHNNASISANATRCAGEQGKYFEMREVLFSNAPALDYGSLMKYGKRVGLALRAFRECLDEKRYAASIQSDIAEASSAGIRGTPSFILGRTTGSELEGVRIDGAVPYATIEAAIDSLLLTKNQ